MKHIIVFFSMLLFTMTTVHAKKCSEFRTQAQAQAYYKSLKKANETGWKSLDRNKDGIACNCLKTNTCSKAKKSKKSNKLISKKPKSLKSSAKGEKKLDKTAKRDALREKLKNKKLKNKKKLNKKTSKNKAKKPVKKSK